MSVPTDKIAVLNAMEDPAHRALLEDMIARMRIALGPMLTGSISEEQFSLTQSMFISAGAMFAGLTAGHLIALGKMKPQDKARATKVVTVAFRNAIKLGEFEARQAMLEQLPPRGRA